MATRHSTRSNAAHGNRQTEATQGQEAAAEMSRQHLTLAAQSTATLFRATEILQRAQLQMLERGGTLFQDTADRLRQASSPAEFMAVQVNLVLSGWQQTLQFGQDIVEASMTLQPEVEQIAEQEQKTVSAGMNGVNPMVQAWQSMFAVPPSTTAAVRH